MQGKSKSVPDASISGHQCTTKCYLKIKMFKVCVLGGVIGQIYDPLAVRRNPNSIVELMTEILFFL